MINVILNVIPDLSSILFHNSTLCNQVGKWSRASIHDRHFWPIYLHQAIIHSHTYQRSQYMFHRTYTGTFIFECCSAAHVSHEITIRFYDWLTGKINALKLETKAWVGRFKGEVNQNPCMQT